MITIMNGNNGKNHHNNRRKRRNKTKSSTKSTVKQEIIVKNDNNKSMNDIHSSNEQQRKQPKILNNHGNNKINIDDNDIMSMATYNINHKMIDDDEHQNHNNDDVDNNIVVNNDNDNNNYKYNLSLVERLSMLTFELHSDLIQFYELYEQHLEPMLSDPLLISSSSSTITNDSLESIRQRQSMIVERFQEWLVMVDDDEDEDDGVVHGDNDNDVVDDDDEDDDNELIDESLVLTSSSGQLDDENENDDNEDEERINRRKIRKQIIMNNLAARSRKHAYKVLQFCLRIYLDLYLLRQFFRDIRETLLVERSGYDQQLIESYRHELDLCIEHLLTKKYVEMECLIEEYLKFRNHSEILPNFSIKMIECNQIMKTKSILAELDKDEQLRFEFIDHLIEDSKTFTLETMNTDVLKDCCSFIYSTMANGNNRNDIQQSSSSSSLLLNDSNELRTNRIKCSIKSAKNLSSSSSDLSANRELLDDFVFQMYYKYVIEAMTTTNVFDDNNRNRKKLRPEIALAKSLKIRKDKSIECQLCVEPVRFESMLELNLHMNDCHTPPPVQPPPPPLPISIPSSSSSSLSSSAAATTTTTTTTTVNQNQQSTVAKDKIKNRKRGSRKKRSKKKISNDNDNDDNMYVPDNPAHFILQSMVIEQVLAAKRKSQEKKQIIDNDENQMDDGVDKHVNVLKKLLSKLSNDKESTFGQQKQRLLEACLFDHEEKSLPVEIIQHLMNADNSNYSWEQLFVDIQSGNLNNLFDIPSEKLFDDNVGECVDLPDDFIDDDDDDNDDNDDDNEKLKLEETLHHTDKVSDEINGHHSNQTEQINSIVNMNEQTLKQSKSQQRRHQRNHRRLLRKFEQKISRLLTEKGDWKNESVWLTLRNRVRDDFIDLIRKSTTGLSANNTTNSSAITINNPIVTSSLSSIRLPDIQNESTVNENPILLSSMINNDNLNDDDGQKQNTQILPPPLPLPRRSQSSSSTITTSTTTTTSKQMKNNPLKLSNDNENDPIPQILCRRCQNRNSNAIICEHISKVVHRILNNPV